MEAGLLAPLPQLQQRLTDAAPDFLNQLGVKGPSQCSERFRECIRESYLGDSGETSSKYVSFAFDFVRLTVLIVVRNPQA